MQAWIFLSLVVLIAASGYGYDDHVHDLYQDQVQDQCDFEHRDKYGVPKNLVPADSELVLLVHGEGYRAYSFDQSTKMWRETGRQVKLTDPKTGECVGSISTDATTNEPVDAPVKYQYSYFADASYAIRTGAKVNQSNPCDKKSAPTAVYDIVESSDYEGLLTGVTHVVVFDTEGGAPPKSHPGNKHNSYADKYEDSYSHHSEKTENLVSISKESANYAFYRGAAPAVKPLPKGHSYSNYGYETYEAEEKPAPKPSPKPYKYDDEEEEEKPAPKPSHKPSKYYEDEEEEKPAPKPSPKPSKYYEEEEEEKPAPKPSPKHSKYGDEEEEAPKPAPEHSKYDDEEEEAPKPAPKPSKYGDEEEEEAPKPAPKHSKYDDEEEEQKPAPKPSPKHSKYYEEEEEEKPAPKPSPKPSKYYEEEEEEEKPAPKPSHKPSKYYEDEEEDDHDNH
jgi:hypothetical protein